MVVNNKLDGFAVTRAGGTVTSGGVVFIAENEFGTKVKVLFSLKDVPNENGGLSKTLVMTEIESKQIPTKEWAELKAKPAIGNRIVNGQTQPTIDIVSGEMHFSSTDNRNIGSNSGVIVLTDNASVRCQHNYGNFKLQGDSTGVIIKNSGYIFVEDQSLVTLYSDSKRTIHLRDFATIYTDLEKRIDLDSLDARLITPSKYSFKAMTVLTDGLKDSTTETAKNLVHFTLSPKIASLNELLKNGSLDSQKIEESGGKIESNTKIILTAENAKGNKLMVTYELQLVPDIDGRETPMLVMVKVEDVAGEAQNAVATLQPSEANPEISRWTVLNEAPTYTFPTETIDTRIGNNTIDGSRNVRISSEHKNTIVARGNATDPPALT